MIHVAGPPDAMGRQRCARCGAKLPDVPGSTWHRGAPIREWRAPDGGDVHEMVPGAEPTCLERA